MRVFPRPSMSHGLEQFWYGHRKHSVLWALLSPPLAAASLIFRLGVAVKNYCYQVGLLRSERVAGATVLSVGNLVVGGTGKTPAVIFLTLRLLHQGKKVAVVSRGFGRRSNDPLVVAENVAAARDIGDEPSLIVEKCKGALVLVGRNKFKLAKRARELGAEIIIIDDGMQHRHLARDAEIVVVDRKAGFGNGHMLPWGPLREPLSSMSRGDLVWLNGIGEAVRSKAPTIEVEYAAVSVRDGEGIEHAPGVLRGQAVFLLSGIARPERFSQLVSQLGANIVGVRNFRDHHWFSESELSEIEVAAAKGGAIVVTTEKDSTRLPRNFAAWSLRMESRIIAGEQHLDRLLSCSELPGP